MGIPASGKTTLSNEISKAFSDKGDSLAIQMVYDNFVPIEKQAQFAKDYTNSFAKILRKNFVLCAQFLINKFSGQDNENTLEMILSSEADLLVTRKSFVENIENLGNLSDNHKNVLIIIDDNNYYHSMRNEFYQVAKHSEVGFCILYCKSSIKTSRRRNSQRPQHCQVPDQVIVEMSVKLEEPNPMENSCDEFCFQIPELVTLDSSPQHPLSNDGFYGSIIPMVVSILEHSLKTPLSLEPYLNRTDEILKERKICSENAVHQADLILRKWIHTELTLASFNTKNRKDLKSLSSELNRKKSAVVEGLKSGEIKLFAGVDQDIEFRKEVTSVAQNVKI